jgi:hypothetical protein
MNSVSIGARDATVIASPVTPSSAIQVENLDHFFGEGELKKTGAF